MDEREVETEQTSHQTTIMICCDDSLHVCVCVCLSVCLFDAIMLFEIVILLPSCCRNEEVAANVIRSISDKSQAPDA